MTARGEASREAVPGSSAVIRLADRRPRPDRVGIYSLRSVIGTGLQVHGIEDVPLLRGWLPSREYLIVTEGDRVVIVDRLRSTCVRVKGSDWVLRTADGLVVVLDDVAFTRWWAPDRASEAPDT